MDDRKGVHVKLLLLLLHVSLIIELVSVSAVGTTEDEEIMCFEKERQALLRFKEGLVDPYGELASWGDEEDKKECCIWKGVTCSKSTYHVVALQLDDDVWHLSGNFSDALLDLQYLNILHMTRVFFTGEIPSFIGSFKELRHLNLSDCYLSGVVPSQLGNLTKLKTLSLGWNHELNVNSLHWLYHLSSLSHLDLSGTYISDTNWLHVISSLPSLKELDLSLCSLPQLTPSSMGFSVNTSFPSLARVDLSYNYQANWLMLSWLLNMSTSLVSIDLSQNQLDGSIPKSFGNFVHLEYLSLSLNGLEGGIPSSFRNLSNLIYLDLSDNQMTEFSPVLRWLFSLRELHLSENKLNRLPHPNFWQHEKLEILDLSYNMLEGSISESDLSNLANLKELSFSFNSIALNSISTGWVPPFQLDVLKLSHCNMGPTFPKWIQTQNNISHLDLSSGGISGYVPEWLWDLSPRLTFLSLSHNQLIGSIPDLSSKFVGYPQIDFSFNNFLGFLPVFHPNSTVLQLSRNRFKGSISSFCTYDKLGVLDLSYNQLSGEIPSCLKNFKGLILDLSTNSFSGKIPCVELEVEALVLHNNNLSGEIPSCLMLGSGLKMFDVGGNQLTGAIPTWLGTNFINLEYLSLRGNEFHGMIPLELCHLSDLHILDLSRNNIWGRIPQCFSNFTSLAQYDGVANSLLSTFGLGYSDYSYDIESYVENVYVTWKWKVTEYKQSKLFLKLIDLSSNKLEGNIPKEFSFMQGLVSLNLSRNHLTGKIDSHIGQMKMLECLDLSRNELSGEIPTGLAQLTFLAVLDLSSNNLSGDIPSSTQIQTFDASTYAGNDGLCGPPLAPCPVAADSPPMSLTKNGKHKHLDVGLYIWVASGFVLGFWGAIGVSFFPSLRRNALFNFWNRVWNWLCVTTVIYVRRLRR